MALADASFHQSENDITGALEETFSVTENCFSEHIIVELRLGSTTQDLMEVNKEGYINLIIAHQIARNIMEQFCMFMEGLRDMLPLDLLHLFNKHKLELLIRGMMKIDMDDWTQFTYYHRYKKTDRVIKWFWVCLHV
jgi:E3 ubiquitin-protein ligase NEDD4